MDRGALLLQDLLRKLRGWEAFVRRSSYAKSVTFEPLESGEFRVVIRWDTKDGGEGSFVREFTKPYAFGGTYSLSPAAWSVEKKACDHAKSLVRDVLTARGAV